MDSTPPAHTPTTPPFNPPPRTRRAPVDTPRSIQFHGTGEEYFLIWLKNMALNLITLGFYSPWAKVARLSFFARNTTIDDYPLEYHAQPWPIFKGRIVGLTIFFVYSTLQGINWVGAIVALVLALVVYPWMIEQALKFRLRYTSYRGIRFGFRPTRKQTYISILGYQALAVITFGLAYPLLSQRFNAYRVVNSYYGGERFGYTASVGDFLRAYLITGGLALVIGLFWFGTVVFGGGFLLPVLDAFLGLENGFELGSISKVLLSVFMALTMIVMFSLPFMLYRALVLRINWNNTTLGQVTFSSELNPLIDVGMNLTSLVLTILTLGLFRPFGAVWLYRYRVNSIHLRSDLSWDALRGVVERKAVALGDEVLDIFDMDLGF